MGSLTLNRKRIFSFPIGSSYGSAVYLKFLDAPSRIISDVLDPEILVNQNLSGTLNIYEGGINGPLVTIQYDIFDFYNSSGSTVITNTYSIPQNSIIVFLNDSAFPGTVLLKNAAGQYAGYFENYYQGKTSINKQNLSTLYPSNTFAGGTKFYPNNKYIYKSITSNTLANVFNFNELTIFTDILEIINGNTSYSFYAGYTNWLANDYTTNANNFVIPYNSIISFNTNTYKSLSVNGGAIIQKYNSGKINLNKNA